MLNLANKKDKNRCFRFLWVPIFSRVLQKWSKLGNEHYSVYKMVEVVPFFAKQTLDFNGDEKEKTKHT